MSIFHGMLYDNIRNIIKINSLIYRLQQVVIKENQRVFKQQFDQQWNKRVEKAYYELQSTKEVRIVLLGKTGQGKLAKSIMILHLTVLSRHTIDLLP